MRISLDSRTHGKKPRRGIKKQMLTLLLVKTKWWEFSNGKSYRGVLNGINDEKVGKISEPSIVWELHDVMSMKVDNALFGREQWVMLEFKSLESMEKFKKCVSVMSWFSQVIKATNEFEVDGRIAWVEVEGRMYWIRANETKWVPEFTDEYESEDDNSMDEGSWKGYGIQNGKGVIANLERTLGTAWRTKVEVNIGVSLLLGVIEPQQKMSKLDDLCLESVISGSPEHKLFTLERFMSGIIGYSFTTNGFDYGPTPLFFHIGLRWLVLTIVETLGKNRGLWLMVIGLKTADVKKEFFDHFANRFGKPDKPTASISLDFPNQISHEQSDHMEREVSKCELKEIGFGMTLNNSGGYSGFVKNPVVALLRKFFLIKVAFQKKKKLGILRSTKVDNVSKGKEVINGLSFYRMETDEISERYIAPCFVNGLEAFDGEIYLAFDENLISNEFAVKLCLDYEFIINPEEDDFEPGVILGRSFLRLDQGVVDFGNGVITIYPESDPFEEESEKTGKSLDN
ncbi:hypothetical protein Tco_0913803 [Tanacetum coccineum]